MISFINLYGNTQNTLNMSVNTRHFSIPNYNFQKNIIQILCEKREQF